MLFLENKYTKIYYQLIEKRKRDPISKDEVYCEKHHIIPKSLGGSNDDNNLVNLLPREHYIAHKLLTKMTSDRNKISMCWAFHRMLHKKNSSFKINSKTYDIFRRFWSEFMRENHISTYDDSWALKVSESIKKSWENDNNRREKTASRMRETQKKLKQNKTYFEDQKERAKLGGQAAKLKVSKKISYNNKTYYGWNELFVSEQITKRQYILYSNGIDVNFRKNDNGPIKTDDLIFMLNCFTKYWNINFPENESELEIILNKMISNKLFLKSRKERIKKIIMKKIIENKHHSKAMEGEVSNENRINY